MVTVRDVIALAAANMGREDLAAAVTSQAGALSGETAALLRCYRLVENEIALDYFPLKTVETLTAANGKLPYADFSYAPVNVTRVTNAKGGGTLAFEFYPDHLRMSEKAERVEVEYSFAPAEKELEDEPSFPECISPRLIAMGVCAEFCLSRGQYAEAAAWEERFHDALHAVNIPRRRVTVRSRRWV